MASKTPPKVDAPVSSLTQVEINQQFTTVLNDIEQEMDKVTTLFGTDPIADGVKNHLRRARDDAASQLGLTKTKTGWAQP